MTKFNQSASAEDSKLIDLKKVEFVLACYFLLGLLYWTGYFLQSHPKLWQSWEFIKSYAFRVLLIQPFFYLMFYKLKNLDAVWKVLLHVIFCFLVVGMWFVGVKLFNNNRFREFEIFGNSFYYDTALMYIFLFGIFHVYEYFILFKKHQIIEKELLILSFESEKCILNAQMQPHFLFNILNSISASVPLQLEEVRELVVKLAQTYRYILNSSKIEYVTVADELFFFNQYLAVENQSFGSIFTFRYSADSLILKQNCPPMFLYSTLYHVIEYLRARWTSDVDIDVDISAIGEMLKFETTITLPAILEKNDFLKLLAVNTSIKQNGYLKDYILSQVSPCELFIVFLLKAATRDE